MEKLSENTKRNITERYREMLFTTFQSIGNNMAGQCLVKLKELVKDEPAELQQSIIDGFIKDMAVITALTSSIKSCGSPASLIYISKEGQAIDLLNIKDLKGEEALNQVLDNFRIS